jgi:hypothetical protein
MPGDECRSPYDAWLVALEEGDGEGRAVLVADHGSRIKYAG